ncbi:Bug family tripartite tricarboxylate transporter substrate binding protein [Belnapia rosea]|uniref:Tripartite-type tricarboxylate transporter, receptor component TctC n=1 Tax=Belnapia rosea TaxID=938405 RepID=A0A1G7AAH9_9PROT|nr:tripartite tricarboxylate transporter substrate binding protein [Belnapia rosea]SDE11809.1 Tripartite-type tricarboxylate transporter, receptor component TctC [Belnapia rosea]
MQRRPLLLAASGLALPFLALPRLARAQAVWPNRPVTILVPYVAGGPSDTLARATGGALQAALGQPVVVENRPGGNGAVAAGLAARAAPDGHTLFVGASGILTINPHILRNLSYDPMRDFAPLTIAISAPNMLVANPRFPPRDVPGLVAWLKANPNQASYGTSGIGSSEHLTMELFAQRTGTQLTHVPYGGGAAAVTDLVGGTTELSFLNISTVAAQVQAGALRALAVGSLTRHPLFPDVPTVDESGVAGFEGGSWHSFVAPRGTPEPVLEAVHAALVAALRQPETEARLTRIGFTVTATSRDAFATRLERELGEWREVVRSAGIVAG